MVSQSVVDWLRSAYYVSGMVTNALIVACCMILVYWLFRESKREMRALRSSNRKRLPAKLVLQVTIIVIESTLKFFCYVQRFLTQPDPDPKWLDILSWLSKSLGILEQAIFILQYAEYSLVLPNILRRQRRDAPLWIKSMVTIEFFFACLLMF